MTFLKRLFSTVILLGVLGGIMFAPDKVSIPLFSISAVSATFFGVFETCSMLKNAGRPTFKWIDSILSAVLVFVFLTLLFGKNLNIKSFLIVFVFSSLYILPLVIAFLGWGSLLFSKQKIEYVERIFLSIGVPLLFLVPVYCIIFTYSASRSLFFFLLLGTKIGDIGAYVFGSLSAKLMKGGNHKIFPVMSPKKSWEGCIGGLVVSMIFGGIVFPFCGSYQHAVILGIAAGFLLYIFGAAGDLAESCIKRACGVKDAGAVFPGIGGMFDLIDSLMMNSILFVVLMAVFKFFKN